MSTKTLRKRISLVAITALTAGVLSVATAPVASASHPAADVANGDATALSTPNAHGTVVATTGVSNVVASTTGTPNKSMFTAVVLSTSGAAVVEGITELVPELAATEVIMLASVVPLVATIVVPPALVCEL